MTLTAPFALVTGIVAVPLTSGTATPPAETVPVGVAGCAVADSTVTLTPPATGVTEVRVVRKAKLVRKLRSAGRQKLHSCPPLAKYVVNGTPAAVRPAISVLANERTGS